ncbi:hypothetical protein [Moorena sp. SIO3I6]|nr:hypothetical protein [Moorena sp. SIO3I6]NEP21128.1 hypothetical protein [Moorena sp. SIO3I6]
MRYTLLFNCSQIRCSLFPDPLFPAPCSLLPQKMHLTKLKKTILIKH